MYLSNLEAMKCPKCGESMLNVAGLPGYGKWEWLCTSCGYCEPRK